MVLTFQRCAEWCPYENVSLSALNEIHALAKKKKQLENKEKKKQKR